MTNPPVQWRRDLDPVWPAQRRRVHGAWHAVGLLAVIVCSMWLGIHGAGPIIGAVLAIAGAVLLTVAAVVAVSLFAGWAVRAIRQEVGR